MTAWLALCCGPRVYNAKKSMIGVRDEFDKHFYGHDWPCLMTHLDGGCSRFVALITYAYWEMHEMELLLPCRGLPWITSHTTAVG